MRRIYHRFPQKCDLTFYIDRPFSDVMRCMKALHESHQTSRQGENLVKLHFLIEIADSKTKFVGLDLLPDPSETVSETADFRISLNETLLTPDRRLPVAENRFFFRVVDAGGKCECFAAKEGSKGDMDAMNLRSLLAGACE